MLKCMICGHEFKQLQIHLKIHKITSNEYMQKYNAQIICNETINLYKKINSGSGNPRYNTKIKFSECALNNFRQKVEIARSKKFGKLQQFKVHCFKCNKEFEVIEREFQFPKKQKYFCCINHANSRVITHSEITRKKLSNSQKQLWQNELYSSKHIVVCKVFNSKNEREIVKYFKDNFLNEEWTSGGCIKFKDNLIVRDLYSNKLKVCIEYDGIWHFKNIHNQLEEKQLKDKLLEEWCIKNNFKLIRISENIYNSDKQYWLNKLINAVYNSTEKIIKFY